MYKEIRQQPEHIRKIFMWTSVVIVFSFISFFWARSTQRQLVALLNPDGDATSNEQGLAVDQTPTPVPDSPFQTIVGSFRDLRANLGEIFQFKNLGKTDVVNSTVPEQTPVAPQALPISQ